MTRSIFALAAMTATFTFAAATISGCEDDDGGGGSYYENAGHPCVTTDDCYPGIDQSSLEGDVVCMDRVPNGYCTHTCQTDDDCCAVVGECESGHPQVCAPFESTGDMYCFLSCEDDYVGTYEPTAYCQRFADSLFGCRSSGGGSLNRKVCVP